MHDYYYNQLIFIVISTDYNSSTLRPPHGCISRRVVKYILKAQNIHASIHSNNTYLYEITKVVVV